MVISYIKVNHIQKLVTKKKKNFISLNALFVQTAVLLIISTYTRYFEY